MGMRDSFRPGTRRTLIALTLFWACCEPPRSKNPLTPPEAAKPDARMAGVWAGRLGERDEALLRVVPREGARFDLVLVGQDRASGAVVLAFEGFPSTIAGRSYLNLRSKTYLGDYAEKTQIAESWIFARYEVTRDGALTLWQMEDEPVKAAIAAHQLAGQTADRVEITASSSELAAYVARADAATLWRRLGTFKRLRVEYPKAAK
jgi:hypothetical protein